MTSRNSYIDAAIASSRKEAQASGMLLYRGRDCVNNHPHAVRMTDSGGCLKCARNNREARISRATRAAEKPQRFAELGRTDVAFDRATARERGMEYYLGERCINGHVGIRYVLHKTCFDCLKAWRIEHSKTNRVELNAYHREYGRRNPGKNYEKVQRWIAKNRDKHMAAVAHHGRLRRARKKGAEGTHTQAEIQSILMLQGQRCAYCGTCQNLSLDHKHPLSKGGSNYASNLQWLCRSHNSHKRDRTDEQYRALFNIDARTPWDAGDSL